MSEEKTPAGKRLLSIGSTVKKVEDINKLFNNQAYFPLDGTEFMVRSQEYMDTKQKCSSQSSILELYGVDWFSSSKKVPHIMRYIKFPDNLPEIKRDDDDGGFYMPQLFVLNIMMPTYLPGLFSYKDDGDTLSFVMYMAFNQKVYNDMKDGVSEAHLLLRKFLQADPTDAVDYAIRGRLKAIPEITNPDEVNLGLLHALVTSYNAKPFLTGPKFHSFVKREKYLEVDVDIHRYVYPARSTFVSLMTEIPSMVVNIAVVVEGRDGDELQERVLAAARVHVDHTTARPLKDLD